MSERQQPPYPLLAGLTSLGIVALLPALFVVSPAARWVLGACMLGLACVVAYYLVRAYRTVSRTQVSATPAGAGERPRSTQEVGASASTSAQAEPDRLHNAALVLGVLGALQVMPLVGSLGAIALAKGVGTSPGPGPEQSPRRPRRAAIAEALGWLGLAIFVVSLVVYLLR